MEKSRKEDKQVLDMTLQASVFVSILSKDMYTLESAIWELIKNGWDAGQLKKNYLPDHKTKVEVMIKNDFKPLSKGRALLVIDNGIGMTAEALDSFRKLGRTVEEMQKTKGVIDMKGIGRLAAFALIDDKNQPFYVFSSVAADAPLTVLTVRPDGKIELESNVSRKDNRLVGIKITDSFTMVVVPGLSKRLKKEKLLDELQWLIPRRQSEAGSGFELLVDGQVVYAPPLEEAMTINYEEIEGYFDIDMSKTPQGLRICDATTNTVVAMAAKLPHRKIPAPLSELQLIGDLFIPDLIKHQSTDRQTLSPDFLESKEWMDLTAILYKYFSPLLKDFLGGEKKISKNKNLNTAMRKILHTMKEIWGKTPEHKKLESEIPNIIDPDDPRNPPQTGGGGKKVKKGKSLTGTDKKPRTARYARGRYFSYQGEVYEMVYDDKMPAHKDAEMREDKNIIHFNVSNPILKHLMKSTRALELYCIEVLIRAIVMANPDFKDHPVAINREVHLALKTVFDRLED